MRILWLNWRDIKNPAAGGAELVTHEVASRWVKKGHSVTLFCASFPGGSDEQVLDGVRIIRRGRQYSVHYQAWRYYSRLPPDRFDIVVDEINTIPFFTPLYVRGKHLAFFHQLAREVWRFEAPFPLNVLGYLLEPLYLRLYRSTATVAVSESTRQDLIELGFQRVYLVEDGVDVTPVANVPAQDQKEENPTVIYVGRLVPSKRVIDIVQAIGLVRAHIPNVQLWLVGDGTRKYIRRLKMLVSDYGLRNSVRFWGKVPHAQKVELLTRAHALALTSVREGWGLVVIEANAVGTPAVVYNVHGLRDSVRHGQTGLVCKAETPRELAASIRTLLTWDELRATLARGALEWSRCFDWDKNADEFLCVVNQVFGEPDPSRAK
jgi:glycosyltransferase involved in cell wall biosynthesis